MSKYKVNNGDKKENTVDIKTSVINTFGGKNIKHVKNGIEISVTCHSRQCNCLMFKTTCENIYNNKIFPILSHLFIKKYISMQDTNYDRNNKDLGCDLNIILSDILITYNKRKYKLFIINHEKQRTIYEIIACCYDNELLKKINEPNCGYKYVYLEQSLSKLKVIENMYYQAYFVTSILCFFDYYGSKKESVKSKTKIANTVSSLQGYVNIEKYRAPLIALWEIIETSVSFWGILLLVWRRILKVTNHVYDAYYDIYLSEDKMHIDDDLVDDNLNDAPPNINIMFRAFLKDVLLITYDINDIKKKYQDKQKKTNQLKAFKNKKYANKSNSKSFKEKVSLKAQINSLQEQIDEWNSRKQIFINHHTKFVNYKTKLFHYNLLHMLYLKNNIYYSQIVKIGKNKMDTLVKQPCNKIVYCGDKKKTNMCNLKLKLNDIKNTDDKKDKLELLNIGTEKGGMTPTQIYELKAAQKKQKIINDVKEKMSKMMKSIGSKDKKQNNNKENRSTLEDIVLELKQIGKYNLLKDDNIILKF